MSILARCDRYQLFPMIRSPDVHQHIRDGDLRAGDLQRRTNPTPTTWDDAGAIAVMKKFIPSGTHHFSSADHILFSSVSAARRKLDALVRIVTASPLAQHHAVTGRADIVTPPASIIEPAIALSIVFVGRTISCGRRPRSARLGGARFGLVPGSALRTSSASSAAARGWAVALFFHFGVEIGQLAVVLLVATLIAAIRAEAMCWGPASRWPDGGVIAAGTYWCAAVVFPQRVTRPIEDSWF